MLIASLSFLSRLSFSPLSFGLPTWMKRPFSISTSETTRLEPSIVWIFPLSSATSTSPGFLALPPTRIRGTVGAAFDGVVRPKPAPPRPTVAPSAAPPTRNCLREISRRV
jgi:hypothetical protein